MGAATWVSWNAIKLIRMPHELPEKFTLYVLLVVIAIKGTMFRYVLKIGRQIDSNAVKADAYHHRCHYIHWHLLELPLR
jgi:divalent metal cation (Fe/Co/Zn/Cd) transporter